MASTTSTAPLPPPPIPPSSASSSLATATASKDQHQTGKWQTAKTQSKAGFDWAWKKLDKLGGPINRFSNKLGCEATWPTDMGRESDKAARILRSFCRDGFYDDADSLAAARTAPESERVEIRGKQRVLKKIPASVIRNAVGLCIFSTMRTGLWISGSGGSGVLVARRPDGTWSPPSGVLMHTVGLGFLAGVDVYDCVVAINTEKALRAFESPRFTLGGELSAVAGPAGAGGLLETELHRRPAPVWNYIKSRGLYAGVQIDGTVVIERGDENELFYGERVSARDILAGKVRHPPRDIDVLLETLKAAQGDERVDESLLPDESRGAPGDHLYYEASEEEDRRRSDGGVQPGFGVPEPEDPDPFGVKALQDTGIEIHEAGTGAKPDIDEFEFHPTPSSPAYRATAASSRGSRGNSVDEAAGFRRRASTLGQDDDYDEAESEEGHGSRRSKGSGRSSARRSVDHSTQTDGPAEADIATEGTAHVRESAEKEALEQRAKDEFATPMADPGSKRDPLDEAGKRLGDVTLEEGGAIEKADKMVNGEGAETKVNGNEETVVLAKGPPPALPPR